MKVAGVTYCDTTNGDGIGVSVFVSGCRLNCKGCFNKDAQSFDYGIPYELVVDKIKAWYAANWTYACRLSILGGEPTEPENWPTVMELVTWFKATYPNKKVWLWTGRTIQDVEKLPHHELIDYVVANPFEYDKKIKGYYAGSYNQQIYELRDRLRFDHARTSELSPKADWSREIPGRFRIVPDPDP